MSGATSYHTGLICIGLNCRHPDHDVTGDDSVIAWADRWVLDTALADVEALKAKMVELEKETIRLLAVRDAEIRKIVIEECAKVAERFDVEDCDGPGCFESHSSALCAFAIRSLASTNQESAGV